MDFAEVLEKVVDLLQHQGRVSYRALKLRFQLDEEFLAGIKDELIDAQRIARDEDEKVLVWTGNRSLESRVQSPESQGQTPIDQTRDARPGTLDVAAERRQLTVMFCDLVGSTALSARLDPEELREVVQGYQETCTAVIRRYEGHIAQHLGDGLLVYFGYPTAHEDDAARAVRTGLEILTALQQAEVGARRRRALTDPTITPPLQVRIGIHTGLVVIGEIGSSEKREVLALGETPNLAARIQGQANPDEVLISAATYRLIEGLFGIEERGQPELKGIATPLTLYRVLNESEAHSRFEVVVRRGLTPLIGREHEYGLLRERWERVKDGAGQVVLLSGEPGIGKSRLVEALKETVEHEGSRCLELRCSPYTQNSALAPVIEHVQRVLGFRSTDTEEEKLQKLIVGAQHAAPRHEHVLLLATLLSLPHPQDFPTLNLSPQKQKEKTHEALVSWLCEEAKQQAITYAWEDLHWADPSTLELLTLFLQQVPTTRLLTVLTFRPEFTPPWGAHSYLSQLSLSRLGRTHVETMVEKVTGGKALPIEVVQQIVSKTDGVPLFVEELTKTVLESVASRASEESAGGMALQALAIPSTLQDSLMARLDRLGTAKEIAQLGATLGREFTYELLTAVSPLSENMLQQGLRQLVESELVYQNGMPPQARYLFKHALVQDTAYQSLLKSRRQQLHQTIGKVLEEQFPETKETQPELLAHHYTEAGLIAQAIPYWHRAGERAGQHSANVEAIRHLTTALELLKTLADTSERAQQELTLQITLGSALMAAKGFGAPEVANAYTRARELCRQVGETPELFPMLQGLRVFYLVRGELQTAHELAEQLMRLAQSVRDPFYLLEAHIGLGESAVSRGELAPARDHFEQGLTFYDPRRSRPPWAWLDDGVVSLSYTAGVLQPLGYPDQASRKIHEALTLAQEQSHPFSLAWALGHATTLHQLRREGQATQARAEALIALSNEQGFPFWVARGTILRGWALAEQGQVEAGMVQMRQGMADSWATGVEVLRAYWLSLLIEAYGKAGQVKEGLSLVTEALDTERKTGAHRNEATLYRLKGELTLQQANTQHPTLSTQTEANAEACFLKAINIAIKQQAKSWELRASTSLARLWQQQGKRAAAHKLLSDVYNWFTEGFDTKDLQEAKMLLEELL